MPAIPADQRTPKGPGSDPVLTETQRVSDAEGRKRNLDEQGRQGNIKQNSTNQGYQHDRL